MKMPSKEYRRVLDVQATTTGKVTLESIQPAGADGAIPTERDLREGFFAASAPDRGLYGRRRIEFAVLGLVIPQGSTRPEGRHTVRGDRARESRVDGMATPRERRGPPRD